MISVDDCEDLTVQLNVADYDLLLVGDGSGNTADLPCGWYCTEYRRGAGSVVRHRGGCNMGSNNHAELMPYIQALWAFQVRKEKNRWSLLPVQVVIVSDSELTVRCGNRQYERKANKHLWAVIDWFELQGYVFRWVHVPRNSNPLNALADQEAGKTRKAIVALEQG